MEVTPPSPVTPNDKPKKLIRNYWPRYHRKAIIVTVIMQLLVVLVIGGALLVAGFELFSIELGLILLTATLATIGVNLLLLSIVLWPLADLTAALTHVSGEPNRVIPPNPNSRNYARSGFQPLLQLVYTLAVKQTSVKDDTEHTSHDILQTALSQTSGAIVTLDETGTIQYASPHAPIVEQHDGPSVLELEFDNGDGIQPWLASVHEAEVRAHKLWLRVPTKPVGEEGRRIFDISASYEGSSSVPVTLWLFDSSERYQPEDDQLDFIAFAAHELRGPVTVIRGYLDVLREELEAGADTSEQQLLLSRLIVSANRLSGYISNILNVARYDRRHLKVHVSEQTAAGVYDSIRDDMALRATSQNRQLQVAIPTDLPSIAADPNSLSEVMANLIDNAIKYSNEGGGIEVSAHTNGNFVQFEVIDHGIGMPGNVVSNLFHKFYRSHRSRESVSGTGIGLYISKAIVESHGGTIEVSSTEGQGSVFSFTVPTYASVAEQLAHGNNTNESLIQPKSQGWIDNHAKFRG